MFAPGLIVFVMNALWIAMMVGLLSARFRDMPQIVSALLQIAFYVTPIIFRPEALSRFAFIVEWNPLAYLIDVVRSPLIGQMPSLFTWGVTGGMAAIGWPIALALTGRYLRRVTYWV
jgi:lipopolysaccharide transport system permease protein